MGAGMLAVGLTTLDVAMRPVDRLPEGEGTTLVDGIALAPAGTAGGAALIAARLGLAVKLASTVGGDLTGRMVRLALEDAGVDTSLLATAPERPTSTTVLAIDSQGRRPLFHALGAGMFTQATPELRAAATVARFVHYGGVGGPGLDGGPGADLLAAARKAGAVVTCDLLARHPKAMSELEQLLPHVDYFMPSVAEAFALTGRDDLAAAADVFLGLGARGCVIKNGSKGSYVALGRERRVMPAHRITPVDTTSCGDSYCAGFIAALDRGWDPVEACRFGTATAALVAQGLGTLGILQSFEATEDAMRETPLLEDAA